MSSIVTTLPSQELRNSSQTEASFKNACILDFLRARASCFFLSISSWEHFLCFCSTIDTVNKKHTLRTLQLFFCLFCFFQYLFQPICFQCVKIHSKSTLLWHARHPSPSILSPGQKGDKMHDLCSAADYYLTMKVWGGVQTFASRKF